MTDLICIDPGLAAVGLARFRDGTLRDASMIKTTPRELFEDRIDTISKQTALFVGEEPVDLVIEYPQIYKGTRDDPNQLLKVAAALGASLSQIVRASSVVYYLPRQWKGQMPKVTHNEMVMDLLTDEEHDVITKCKVSPSLLHNVLDAVGLGLHHLRRDKE
jgi:Holliday junction resolvasome RuvABC endonuclease subunit